MKISEDYKEAIHISPRFRYNCDLRCGTHASTYIVFYIGTLGGNICHIYGVQIPVHALPFFRSRSFKSDMSHAVFQFLWLCSFSDFPIRLYFSKCIISLHMLYKYRPIGNKISYVEQNFVCHNIKLGKFTPFNFCK